MADNYQALIPQWREKFLTLDILDKARQLELTVSGDSIYISYYNRDYVVSVSTGEIKNRRDPNAYIPLSLIHIFLTFIKLTPVHFTSEKARPRRLCISCSGKLI